MKTIYKEFKHCYLTIDIFSFSWFDLLPRVTFHTEELSRFVVIGWLCFRMEIDLKWTEKQEREYNGD